MSEKKEINYCSCPYEIELIAWFPERGLYEFRIHSIFDHLRVRGEWFKGEHDLLTYINYLQNNEKTAYA